MTIFQRLGLKAKPSANDIQKRLAEAGAALAGLKSRDIAIARKRQEAVTALDEQALFAADEEARAVRLKIELQESTVSQLQSALDQASKAETRAALEARAKSARQAVEVEAATLLAKYDEHAAALAAALARLKEIEAERVAVNADLLRAGLPAVVSVDDIHRREPDRVTPARTVKRTEWVRWDQYAGRDVSISVMMEHNGKMVPSDGRGRIIDAREVAVEETIPEQRAPGRRLPPLDDGLKLPPGRVGSEQHWPRLKAGGRS